MIRLAMSMVVRDEADVIETNIRFHALQGISFFIVTDNGSVDGTREILEKLKSEFHLEIIDEPARTIDQDLWMSNMAQIVYEKNYADWLINNDADELWYSSSGNLVSEVSSAHNIIIAKRTNMLPSIENSQKEDFSFYHNTTRAIKPYGDEPTPGFLLVEQLTYPIMLRTIGSKVMNKVEKDISITMGNHSVKMQNENVKSANKITIFHYPIRSYKQFISKVKNYGESLMNNPRLSGVVSWHLQRWYNMFEGGSLFEEYESILDHSNNKELFDSGTLCVDDTIVNYIEAHPNEFRL